MALERWVGVMVPRSVRSAVAERPVVVQEEDVRTLRTVVQENAGLCFLDTDGVTRDAARMMQIMDGWQPKQSDSSAGVRRNSAFDPHLPVVVTGKHVRYPSQTDHPGQTDVLFTLVPADGAV